MAPRSPLERRRASFGPDTLLFYEEPLDLVRGDGAYVWDREGRRYLDAYNNVPHVGHCHPRVVAAGQAQLAALNVHSRYLNETVTGYAERLLATLPPELDRITFTCTGSEANELALRMARRTSGHRGVVVSAFSYHGNSTLLAGLTTAMPTGEPFPPWARAVDLLAPGSVDRAVGELEAEGHGVAAMLLDPVLSFEGVLDLPAGMLREAIGRVRAAGGCFIADEVQSGFGRTGRGFWGWERFGVTPDFVTMGKPMANGWPMAAVAARSEVADAFQRDGIYFNTFAASPVGAAMGHAVLDVLADEQRVARAERIGEGARAALSAISGVEAVRGAGLYLGVQLESGTAAKRAMEAMRRAGVLVGRTGPANDVLKLRPPMCFSEADLDMLAGALAEAIRRPAGARTRDPLNRPT
ncbi:MAG: aminotransferase class III-fold pyridoxal phosphate-dependent enzyme [Sphingomonas sp.]